MSEDTVPGTPREDSPFPDAPATQPEGTVEPPYAPQPEGAVEPPYAPQPDPYYTPQPEQQQQYYVPSQPNYSYAPQQQPSSRTAGIGSAQKEKWVAAALAVFFGTLGIHKFYLGYKTEGIIMLLVTLLGAPCFFLGPCIMLVISYIETVRYLILTQEDFERVYIHNPRGWF
jgi:TM2 domain-containing membrane protein YozV